MEEQEFSPLVRAVGVIDENRNFIPYGSTMVAKGLPLFFFKTKEEYDQHAPTLPEPCAVITLDDIDTGGFEFDDAIDPESENAVQNKVIAAALEALRDKANFDRPGMVQFTDSPTVTDRNSGLGLSAVEKNSTVSGSLAEQIAKKASREDLNNLFRGGNISNANDAPIGICAAEPGAENSAFSFWCTLITTGSGDFVQQLALPWSRDSVSTIKYRVKDSGIWTGWQTIA